MRKSLPPTMLAAVAALAVGGTAALAAVVARDLPKQLEFLKASEGRAAVVYGEILDADRVEVPFADHAYTRLVLKVESRLLGAEDQDTLHVYYPGFGSARLSISPSEEETRIGEKVVLFLRRDDALTEIDEQGYKLDSFAEAFRTQKNRKGDVVVIGEGEASAVAKNTKLGDLASQVQAAYAAIQQSGK